MWTYKVVKTQRGNDGKWFRYPGKGFADVNSAKEYAARFAAEQVGVVGTRILVIARKGGAVVASYVPEN